MQKTGKRDGNDNSSRHPAGAHWILQLLLLLIFCISAGFLYYHMVAIPKENRELAETLKEDFPGEQLPEDPSKEEQPAGEKNTMQPLVDLAALQDQYPDIRGWLTIPDTGIDYPVLQGSADDPEYYLHRNYKGEQDINGSLFLQWNCDVREGENLIIYGHNMGVNNTDRFSNLQKYRDADYYTAHPYLQLDTLYKSEIYKIVAVYAVTSRESDGDVFYFNQYINLDDATEQTFLDEVAKRAFYTTGDYAYPTERLLTLSTCTYQMDDARMVILARPLRDGETTAADEVHINSDPLLPARWPAGK